MMDFNKLYIFTKKIIRTHKYQNISFLTLGVCPQSAVANNTCNITGNMCNSDAECPFSRLCCEDRCGRSCKLPGISFIYYIYVMLKCFSFLLKNFTVLMLKLVFLGIVSIWNRNLMKSMNLDKMCNQIEFAYGHVSKIKHKWDAHLTSKAAYKYPIYIQFKSCD